MPPSNSSPLRISADVERLLAERVGQLGPSKAAVGTAILTWFFAQPTDVQQAAIGTTRLGQPDDTAEIGSRVLLGIDAVKRARLTAGLLSGLDARRRNLTLAETGPDAVARHQRDRIVRDLVDLLPTDGPDPEAIELILGLGEPAEEAPAVEAQRLCEAVLDESRRLFALDVASHRGGPDRFTPLIRRVSLLAWEAARIGDDELAAAIRAILDEWSQLPLSPFTPQNAARAAAAMLARTLSPGGFDLHATEVADLADKLQRVLDEHRSAVASGGVLLLAEWTGAIAAMALRRGEDDQAAGE